MFEKKRTSSSLEVKYKLTRGSSRLLHSTLYLDIYNFMTDIFHTLQQTCFLRQLNWAWCEDLLRLIQWDRRGPLPDPQVVHALFWNTFSEYLQENAVEQSHIQWSYSLLLVLPACQLSDKLFCFSSFILEISYWQKKKAQTVCLLSHRKVPNTDFTSSLDVALKGWMSWIFTN